MRMNYFFCNLLKPKQKEPTKNQGNPLAEHFFFLPDVIDNNLYAKLGVTCTFCNIFHGWLSGQTNGQQNDVRSPKNNAAAG